MTEFDVVRRMQLPLVWATVANTLPAGFWVLYWVIRDPVTLRSRRPQCICIYICIYIYIYINNPI